MDGGNPFPYGRVAVWHNIYMTRRFIPVLLIVAMCWQSLAFAGQIIASGAADEVEHAVLHWNSVMHHHDDQDKVHKDSSSDSKRHLVADSCHNAPFVVAEQSSNSPVSQRAEVPAALVISPPDPFLQGIKRPPR